MVGRIGVVDGITAQLLGDAAPVPTLLTAATVKVYVVPLVNPVTVAGLALALVADCAAPAMYGVIVYEAVSYTHLDVYKRQTLSGIIRITLDTKIPTRNDRQRPRPTHGADTDPA